MLDLALVGFRYGDKFKVFKIVQGNTSPEFLGNVIASRLYVQASWLTNDTQNYGIFANIFQPTEESKNSYIFQRRLPDIENKISNLDFTFLNFLTLRKRRGCFNEIVIPNDNLELNPLEIQKYKWAYIYNLQDKKLEFYGKDFPFVYSLNSSIDMPYFAGINVNTLVMLNGIQKKFDVVQFLPRIHEQEYILQESIKKEKPHKHSETRKKPTRRSY